MGEQLQGTAGVELGRTRAGTGNRQTKGIVRWWAGSVASLDKSGKKVIGTSREKGQHCQAQVWVQPRPEPRQEGGLYLLFATRQIFPRLGGRGRDVFRRRAAGGPGSVWMGLHSKRAKQNKLGSTSHRVQGQARRSSGRYCQHWGCIGAEAMADRRGMTPCWATPARQASAGGFTAPLQATRQTTAGAERAGVYPPPACQECWELCRVPS